MDDVLLVRFTGDVSYFSLAHAADTQHDNLCPYARRHHISQQISLCLQSQYHLQLQRRQSISVHGVRTSSVFIARQHSKSVRLSVRLEAFEMKALRQNFVSIMDSKEYKLVGLGTERLVSTEIY